MADLVVTPAQNYYKITYTLDIDTYNPETDLSINEVIIDNIKIDSLVATLYTNVTPTEATALPITGLYTLQGNEITLYAKADETNPGQVLTSTITPVILHNSVNILTGYTDTTDPYYIAAKEYVDSYKINIRITLEVSKESLKIVEYSPTDSSTYVCSYGTGGNTNIRTGKAVYNYFALADKNGNYITDKFNLSPDGLPYVVVNSTVTTPINNPAIHYLGTFTVYPTTTFISSITFDPAANVSASSQEVISSLFKNTQIELSAPQCLTNKLRISFSRVKANSTIRFRITDNTTGSLITSVYYYKSATADNTTKVTLVPVNQWFEIKVSNDYSDTTFKWDEFIYIDSVSGYINFNVTCDGYASTTSDIVLSLKDAANSTEWKDILIGLPVTTFVRWTDSYRNIEYENFVTYDNGTPIWSDYELRILRVGSNENRGLVWLAPNYINENNYYKSYGEFRVEMDDGGLPIYHNLLTPTGEYPSGNYRTVRSVLFPRTFNL